MIKLSPKREAFCQAMLKTNNQTEAYRKVYDCKNSKPKTVHEMACGLMKDPKVSARLAELRGRVVERAEINAAELVKQIAEIATADPNELTQHRRVNCRYCNGIDHQYQWRHKGEFAKAVDDWEIARDAHEDRMKKATKKTEFKRPCPTDDGGYGYRASADLDPGCPVCEGEGVADLFLADTRKLSPAGKRLFAGVKQTKNGIEIMMHSQDAARRMLGENFGIFKTVVDNNMNHKGAVQTIATEVKDPIEAAKLYQKMMG